MNVFSSLYYFWEYFYPAIEIVQHSLSILVPLVPSKVTSALFTCNSLFNKNVASAMPPTNDSPSIGACVGGGKDFGTRELFFSRV